ncbi:helix-turn-helix transcriptional regulator [Nocardioides agariphilus]|uniref:Helix-turn-helix transcriptional regulator n=1 Tax=Nocardioides agariphilus TaxID=433664 RepID=A0A930VRV0_9ACTN|nr:helix-turn-helix transcriptional regulator [Nocardioides agariphilus]
MELTSITPDVAGLRALGHPTRLKMLGMLRSEGPATATTLATRLGINTGQTSYHLRQLAQHGFIVDERERGDGRDRWWKAAHQSTRTAPEPADPADREAFDAYIRAVAMIYAQNIQDAVREGPLLPKAWREASTFSDYHVRVTAKHAEALTTRMHELFMELREDADDDPDAADFVFQFQAFPRPGHLGGEEA